MTDATPPSIVVVVPARNEAARLPGCVESLQRARAEVSVPVRLVVVLDDSTDASAVAAEGVDEVVLVRHRNVGAARAAGFEHVRDGTPGAWLVSTDADCHVEPWWLQRHLAHAAGGARAVCGTVAVHDWSALDARTRRNYEATYRGQRGHRHIHGANLGVASDDYWAVAGFAPLATGEDVDLVHRLQQHGVPITWAGDLAVRTSARLHGRAPSGFAAHLRTLHGSPDPDARGVGAC
ncbi:glycosyltransferase [Aldersonia sp. NBC_00410]|uniref:glycosyltransferase n=1 Tax=Aldersonia sp. NBC_00410 TaxID=2975954 RepID=UPI002258A92C|nr:glycosyltransferase [Aldersonia sp. NBC_00410]MCX5045423.1 glycosyltransferase [Aldersonia sp. NBC_00410]